MCSIASSTPSTIRTAMIGVEVLGAPVLLGRRLHARIDAPASPHRRALRSRRRAGRAAIGARCVAAQRAVDQQRLGRAADAGAPHLRVQHDRARHLEIGVAVDVDVADALEVADHRHARLLLHALHEALAAARHDHVDAARSCRRASRRPPRGRWSAPAGSRPRAGRRRASPSTRQAWIAALE